MKMCINLTVDLISVLEKQVYRSEIGILHMRIIQEKLVTKMPPPPT